MPPNNSAGTILDQMHRAIMTADFAALGDLTPLLDHALQNMGNGAAQLRRLKSKAERNAACLLAAGRGVRAAQNRILELRRANTGLHIYNGAGQRADLAINPGITRRF